MHTSLLIVMLAGCALGTWGPMREGLVKNLSQWGPMALMLVAMADTSIGPGVIPEIIWALLLLLASPLPLLLLPKNRRGEMELQRSLSMVAMFALLATSLSAASLGPLHQTHEHAGLGRANPALAAALSVAVIVYSIVLALRRIPKGGKPGHRRGVFEPVEVLSSAAALGAMNLMAF